jgi:hypothetical protein
LFIEFKTKYSNYSFFIHTHLQTQTQNAFFGHLQGINLHFYLKTGIGAGQNIFFLISRARAGADLHTSRAAISLLS